MVPEEHKKEIFISYAWGGESEEMVDAIAQAFAEHGYTVTRDRSHLAYRESIKNFMDRIGRGKYIIAVVSDKYMKSEYCMYEAYRMFQSPEFNKRVYPIVLNDANIFDFDGQASYLLYWTKKLREVRQQHREVSEENPTVAIPLTMRLRDIETTTRFINDFMAQIADMNVLKPDHHVDASFGFLIQAIDGRKPKPSMVLDSQTQVKLEPQHIIGITGSRTQMRSRQRVEVRGGNPERILINEPINMKFVRIPASEFLMGSDPKVAKWAPKVEQPQHRTMLSEYYIALYPVTNSQYEFFVSATGCKPPSSWKKGNIPTDKAENPVVDVSWYDAVAFCEWLSIESGHIIRLPTEAEWEKAARGTKGQIYPWGNMEPIEKLANFNENLGRTTEVGKYSPQGDSPYGCVDMAGNVWEWVADWYGEKYYSTLKDGVDNPTGPEKGEYRVCRGGSWVNDGGYLRAAHRDRADPNATDDDLGFRCACST